MDRKEINIRLDQMNASDMDDLLYLQEELTEDLLGAFDVHAPGMLAQRGSELIERFQATRLAN